MFEHCASTNNGVQASADKLTGGREWNALIGEITISDRLIGFVFK
ncbi:MAG: hypothetical protein SGJ27_09930 [Candidatus Melainabacteria bacterium]|nr:hypothetical protein [Candidatus Melainabacteria bacterium]